MTTRVKTVEFAFPLATASVAVTTARDFTGITVYIPESSPTFKSVILEVSCQDNQVSVASVTAILLGISLAAVGRDDATVTQTITNSGENQTLLVTRDVTSYFTTNWTGTSMAAGCRLTTTDLITINCTAKLIITYEYNDTATTQLKTVYIPVDGNTAVLTTTFADLGGVASQIPLLDTWLPEAGVTIRNYFFQMDTNTATTAAATGTLDLRYDGSTTVSDLSWARTANSSTFYRRIDVLTGLSTSAAHSIEAKATSTTAMGTNCLSGVIVVTYEFNVVANTTLNGAIDASTTSVVVTDASAWPAAPFTIQVENEKMRVTSRSSNTLTVTRAYDGTSGASHSSGVAVLSTLMNSVRMGLVNESGWVGGTTTSDKSRTTSSILVTEPGLIALKQSAVFITTIDGSNPVFDLRMGSQTSRTYTLGGTARCGGMSFMRRIDSGATGGAGMTLARGYNDIVVDFFTSSATATQIGSNASGLLYLNYTSGQSAPGGGDHNHTTAWMIQPYAATGLVQRLAVTPTAVSIPETTYYLQSTTLNLITQTSSTGAANLSLAAHCGVLSGEAEGGGWRPVYTGMYSSDAEIGPSISFGKDNVFKRWPNDPDTTRLDLEGASRPYRFDVNVNSAAIFQAYWLVTHNAITFSKTITISGSGGSSVSVAVCRAATARNPGMVLWSGSRTGNGTVSATLFEDTETKFTESRETDSYVGRSGNWT